MDRREIISLHLAPIYKTRLSTFGYLTVGDLQGVSAEKLSRDTGLNSDDTSRILEIVSKSLARKFKPRSALAQLECEETSSAITTLCEQLDTSLGGGIDCGRITEVCGLPGAGKTQLCLQLACDVQIPALFGGLESEAVYIDSDGGFIVERITDIATATVRHCQFIASSQHDEEITHKVSSLTVEKLLSGIHVYSCHDNNQVLSALNMLPGFLSAHKKVKLVVLDSVAAHFKQDFDDLSLRTRILTHLAQTLVKQASELNVAVVVTNKMTTKVRQSQSSQVVPALGDSWGHACCTRLLLQKQGPDREVWLIKLPSQPETRISYQITKDGIRDTVPVSSLTDVLPEKKQCDLETKKQPAKRQRLS